MSSLAWAQQAPELNEIVVTATRIDSPILESPSAISLVTSTDIAASGAHDLSGVIQGQIGTVVNDYGPIGSAKSVSLRGSTSDQVLVLLDGVRLNSGRVSSGNWRYRTQCLRSGAHAPSRQTLDPDGRRI